MTTFGTLKRKSLREIWPNEARDFTRWLEENVGHLGEALGIELELSQSEAPVGDFSLDLLATDLGTGGKVIIENQLTPTDHDHLGKLITYAAGFGAEKVIWVAESVRDEHRQALEWLNQRTDEQTQFFAVTVEVLQIDDSLPAFDFRAFVLPNEWQKTAKRKRTSLASEKGERYRAFHQGLIDELRENHHFTGMRVAQPWNWCEFGSGCSGIRYGFSFNRGGFARVELNIVPGDAERNKAVFDYLASHREEIEADFGEKLWWERLDNKRTSRIALYRSGAINDTDEKLQEIREWAVNNLLIIDRVFGKWLREALAQASEAMTCNIDEERGSKAEDEMTETSSSHFEDG